MTMIRGGVYAQDGPTILIISDPDMFCRPTDIINLDNVLQWQSSVCVCVCVCVCMCVWVHLNVCVYVYVS